MFTRTRSVASITSGLGKMISDLEGHADAMRDEAQAKAAEAARLMEEADGHTSEAAKAKGIAAKIGALIS